MIKFESFSATAIVPETRQIVCVLEPLDPTFHGKVSIGRVVSCGICPLESEIPAGSRVMFPDGAGHSFTLYDQPHVLLRRGEVIATIKEDAGEANDAGADPGTPGLR